MLILLALLAFQVKHLICDFILQTKFQAENKGYYGHLAGLSHAGLHALFSVPALFVLTGSPGAIVVAIGAEFLIHYHVDWFKARTEGLYAWTPQCKAYWIAFGIDQFLHQVTYLGMVAWLIV